jgi:hypothetical protein
MSEILNRSYLNEINGKIDRKNVVKLIEDEEFKRENNNKRRHSYPITWKLTKSKLLKNSVSNRLNSKINLI